MIKLLGGAGEGLKNIGSGLKDNLTSGMSFVLGEDFTQGFTERFEESFNKINELFSGETNAPATYFNNIKDSADGAGDSIEKSFGQTMKDKLKTFKDSIKSVQESMADVVVKGIKGMEDALVNFVTTGKLSFKDLTKSIIADMARMAIQQSITKPLANFVGGLFNAKGNVFNQQGLVSAYAKGGVVDKPTFFRYGGAGKLGVLGEAGSEAILPLSRGSNGKLGVQASGGTGTVINVSVDASSTDVSGNANEGNQLGQAIANAVQNELLIQQRPGGLLSAA